MGNLGNGVKQLNFSVKDSISGVFLKPVEMMNKEGLLGAFKGAMIGVSGLVTKPITGILDATSQTTGVVSTMATKKEERPNKIRIRAPRAFYDTNHYFNTYDHNDAWTIQFFKEHSNKRIDILACNQMFESGKNGKRLFIISR